jgi:hypothetical protein
VQPIDDLAAKLPDAEEWDERTVVVALRAGLESNHPRFLASARAAWSAPYLELELTHDDGTILTVVHGDGYTALTGGGMEYRGYLDTSSLIDVLVGALRGQTTYVKLARDERAVADYFEVAGREGERLGYSSEGLVGAAAVLLLPAPPSPNAKQTLHLSFDTTPAIKVG